MQAYGFMLRNIYFFTFFQLTHFLKLSAKHYPYRLLCLRSCCASYTALPTKYTRYSFPEEMQMFGILQPMRREHFVDWLRGDGGERAYDIARLRFAWYTFIYRVAYLLELSPVKVL